MFRMPSEKIFQTAFLMGIGLLFGFKSKRPALRILQDELFVLQAVLETVLSDCLGKGCF